MIPSVFLRDDIVIRRRTGQGTYGPTYGEPEMVKGLFRASRQIVIKQNSTAEVGGGYVLVRPGTGLKVGDKLVVNGIEYQVVETRLVHGPAGRPYAEEATIR